LFILISYGNKALSSGLVQFLAVLGIDTETKRLRTAKNYSYMLAGMVYCAWVLGVEKLLPAAERDEQTEDNRDSFYPMAVTGVSTPYWANACWNFDQTS
jgi:hypothetical protein